MARVAASPSVYLHVYLRECCLVISAANLVVNDGNTLLSDRHVEMLTILRMNRAFMEFMRANYNSVARQQFGASIVDMVEAQSMDML